MRMSKEDVENRVRDFIIHGPPQADGLEILDIIPYEETRIWRVFCQYKQGERIRVAAVDIDDDTSSIKRFVG